VEAQDVTVFDGVGDRVLVQTLLEEVLGGLERGNLALNLPDGGIGREDGRAGEAEELGLGEELPDGLMVVAELGAVALIEDKDHPLVAERIEQVLVGGEAILLKALVSLAVLIERKAELLDGGDDDLVGPFVGKEPPDESAGVALSFIATPLAICSMSSTWSSERTGLPWTAAHSANAFVLEPNGLWVRGLIGPPRANCDS
jgi:hypothetical protein